MIDGKIKQEILVFENEIGPPEKRAKIDEISVKQERAESSSNYEENDVKVEILEDDY